MHGDITLEALRRCQRASKVISPFIIMDARSAMRPCYILPMFFFIFFYARLSWPNGEDGKQTSRESRVDAKEKRK